MKKRFVEPTLRRYDLSLKENILASGPPEWWGHSTFNYYFTQYKAGVPVDQDDGCFALLTNHFATANHMDTAWQFHDWVSWLHQQEGQTGYVESCAGPGGV